MFRKLLLLLFLKLHYKIKEYELAIKMIKKKHCSLARSHRIDSEISVHNEPMEI